MFKHSAVQQNSPVQSGIANLFAKDLPDLPLDLTGIKGVSFVVHIPEQYNIYRMGEAQQPYRHFFF